LAITVFGVCSQTNLPRTEGGGAVRTVGKRSIRCEGLFTQSDADESYLRTFNQGLSSEGSQHSSSGTKGGGLTGPRGKEGRGKRVEKRRTSRGEEGKSWKAGCSPSVYPAKGER